MMNNGLAIALCCGLLVGCASPDPYGYAPVAQRLQQDDALGDCARLFQVSDRLIDEAGTRDAQAPRVPGFPYRRADRILAQMAAQSDLTVLQAQAWSATLAVLDATARRIELGNAGHAAAALTDALAACRQLLAWADQHELPALLGAVQVPDDYSTAMRALGLYPLTRYAFAAGIRSWQRDTLAEFAAQTATDPFAAMRRRYTVSESLAAMPTLLDLPELGLPVLARQTLTSLIFRHAPQLDIATVSDADQPGALVWRIDSDGRLRIGVALNQPVLYVRTSHAHFTGRWLLQLIYTAWFPARPPVHAYDVLAGRLDGLMWRVTLAEDGTPLVYDTIHPCGCYHLFIPTEQVQARPQTESIDENLFAPQTLRSLATHERVVLKIAAGTHYLQRVEIDVARPDHSVALVLRDDDELRALPLPDGCSRSAFTPDGLIDGSERRERFYFWPMGVVSAGQMRQWGRHATAFVGRRHFDDPTLIDRYFERLP